MANDLEKGNMFSTSEAISSPTLTVPDSPNPVTKRYSQLETFQILVGNPEAPPSPNANEGEDFYHEILAQERRATQLYWTTLILFFGMIAMQIALCLGIAVGAQLDFTRDTISELAALNTAVAAGIAILKALGLPDKKGMERMKLRRLLDRIRITIKKLKVGLNVDAPTEAEALRKLFDDAEDAAQLDLKAVEAGVSGGASATKTTSAST